MVSDCEKSETNEEKKIQFERILFSMIFSTKKLSRKGNSLLKDVLSQLVSKTARGNVIKEVLDSKLSCNVMLIYDRMLYSKYLLHGGNFGGQVLSGHSVFGHDNVTRGGESELVDTNNLGGVLVPRIRDTGFHGNSLCARRRKDGFLVFGRLSLVNFHARHGDNTGSRKVGGGLKGVLDLRSGGKDDQVQVSGLSLGNVSSLKSSLTSGHVVHIVVLVNVLTREDKGGRSFLAGGGVSHGGNSFLGISRSVDIQVRDDTKTGDGLDRLVGRSILTDSDRIVGKNVRDGSQLGKGGNTDGRSEVVNEDQEGRSRDLEKSVEGESVHDGSHGVFTDTEVQVLSAVGLVETSSEVSSFVDVVSGRSVKIGRSGDVVRDKAGDLLDDLVSGDTGGLGIFAHGGDFLDHVLSRHGVVSNGVFQLLGKFRVGLTPGLVSFLPFVVDTLVLGLDVLEEITSSLRDVPLLSLRKANVLLGVVNVWDTGFSVSGVGSLGLFHSLSDDGVALDELRLSVVGGLGGGDGFLDGIKVVSVNFVGLPSVGLVSGDDVFGLGVFGHLVKSDFVGIVQDNEVVKLLVGGESGGLGGDTLLEATISGKSVDVVVEDLVVVGVVDGGSHLFGGGHTDGVGDTLPKRTGGALNSGGVVFGGREFRVTRGHGVVLTEVLDFFHRKVKSGKVQPGVKEHGSVSGGKDESITVDPGRVSSVVLHLGSVKGSSNFGGSERKTHVSRVGGGNGVHGKTTGFIGSGGKSSLGVSIDSSALQESWLNKSKYPKKQDVRKYRRTRENRQIIMDCTIVKLGRMSSQTQIAFPGISRVLAHFSLSNKLVKT